MNVSEQGRFANVKPSILAATVVLALKLLRDVGSWPRTAREAIRVMGAAKSQAYAMLARLEKAIEQLEEPMGRPLSAPDNGAELEVAVRVRDFVMDHPGVVSGQGRRRYYADSFRRFVLRLLGSEGPGAGLSVKQAARATGVPVGTLKDWRRLGLRGAQAEPAEVPNESQETLASVAPNPQLATILEAYRGWKGTFVAFCDHLREDYKLPFGRSFIASVLLAAGLRVPSRRRQPCDPWRRGSFETFFPGVQWIGDGKTVVLTLHGHPFVFNVEAIVDADSNAVVGVDVSDTEDEACVIDAYQNGVANAGNPPLALSLDARPSNHTPAVRDAVAPALLLEATPGRGEAKAPTEGTFGLLEQTTPKLEVEGHTPRELARSVVHLLVSVWAWARNGKPRGPLGGRTPAAHYLGYEPNPEEVEAAKAWLAELHRRQQQARQTRARRADPTRRTLLREGLAELGIADSENRLAVALARYGTEAILRGLSIFRAKRDAGTIPHGADPGRYLGGVIRNLNDRFELEVMAAHLLQARLRCRDLSLEPFQRRLHEIERSRPPDERPAALVDTALEQDAEIAFRFFRDACGNALIGLAPARRHGLYPDLVRRAASTFKAKKHRREDLIAVLSKAVVS